MSSYVIVQVWNVVFDRFVAEGNAQEKRKLMYGLAAVKEPWIIHRFIDLAQNESNVRSQVWIRPLLTGFPISFSSFR